MKKKKKFPGPQMAKKIFLDNVRVQVKKRQNANIWLFLHDSNSHSRQHDAAYACGLNVTHDTTMYHDTVSLITQILRRNNQLEAFH